METHKMGLIITIGLNLFLVRTQSQHGVMEWAQHRMGWHYQHRATGLTSLGPIVYNRKILGQMILETPPLKNIST